MITSKEKCINSSHRNRKGSRGFTLLELMITMVIVAIGVALAVPTYQDTLQKRRLTRAAENISSLLAVAQGEAIKRNEVVVVSIKRSSSGTSWCVGAMIKTAAADHCNCESTSIGDSNYCDFNPDGVGAPQVINQVGFDSFSVVTAVNSLIDNDFHFNFDPVRGIKVTDLGVADGDVHDIALSSSNGNYSLRVDTSVTGRIRVCNPDSEKKVPGYKSCPVVIVAPPPPPAP